MITTLGRSVVRILIVVSFFYRVHAIYQCRSAGSWHKQVGVALRFYALKGILQQVPLGIQCTLVKDGSVGKINCALADGH
jgi:hypothetical protein